MLNAGRLVFPINCTGCPPQFPSMLKADIADTRQNRFCDTALSGHLIRRTRREPFGRCKLKVNAAYNPPFDSRFLFFGTRVPKNTQPLFTNFRRRGIFNVGPPLQEIVPILYSQVFLIKIPCSKPHFNALFQTLAKRKSSLTYRAARDNEF
jgi:hypothetical protein